MRKIDECDMEKLGTSDGREKAIAILELDGGHNRPNRKGIR